MSTSHKHLHIALIAGGASSEHEVSLQSATTIYSALKNIDATIYPIYLNKVNQWFLLDTEIRQPYLSLENLQAVHLIKNNQNLSIYNPTDMSVLGHIDVIFPALHGRYGEDGAIQGLFELWGVPYVGSGVKASSVAMDKEFAKILLSAVNIPTLPHLVLHRKEQDLAPSFSKVCQLLDAKSLFVKPSSAGSSVGITHVESSEQWFEALSLAFTHDNKLLIEPALKVREIEIAVLDNGKEIKASLAGEISYQYGFYDYDQKYANDSKVELKIPTIIEGHLLSKIQQFALQAHQQLGCGGLSRVDFFLVDNDTIYLNEINTLPGFTSKSMYPLLWQHSGISIEDLLKDLIQHALHTHDS